MIGRQPQQHEEEKRQLNSAQKNESDQAESATEALENEVAGVKSYEQEVAIIKDRKEEEEEDDEDDEDDDVDENDREPEDSISALYEKVQRTKTKFRCFLNDVMIHIKGKDYVLKKLTADIEY